MQSVDDIPAECKFDLVQSYIVFQHIPVDIGYGVTEKILSKLAPGGIAALHFTTQRRLSAFRSLIYFIKHYVPLAYYLFNVLQGKKFSEPLMQGNNYNVVKILDIYVKSGLVDLFLVPDFADSFGFVVYGRKPESTSR